MQTSFKNPIPMAYRNLVLACAVSLLGAIGFGYAIGYSSPAVPGMIKSGVLVEEQGSWFASIMSFGALLGCPLAGWLVEKLGRKPALFVASIPFLIGWGLIGMTTTIPMLYVARLCTGVACGMVCVVSPMYIAEISTKELRGMLGSGVQLSVTIGILLAYAFGVVCSWNVLALIAAILPILSLVLTVKIPETPRYYLMRGDKQAALRSLSWLRGSLADIDEECRDIEESLPDKEEKLAWSEFKKQELLRPLQVGVGLMLFQQLTGINVVMFYTVSIFQGAGYEESSESATVVIGVVQVLATIVACLLMDKAGRRLLLFISGIFMGITCCTLGYYYHTIKLDPSRQSDISWLALASLVLYIIAFALGWGPIPMLVMSEIFPVKARGPASAITVAANWTMAFIITKEFPNLVSILSQAGTFWLFGIFCFTSVLFVWRFVPETKGKSLEDIELYFLGRAIRGI